MLVTMPKAMEDIVLHEYCPPCSGIVFVRFPKAFPIGRILPVASIVAELDLTRFGGFGGNEII